MASKLASVRFKELIRFQLNNKDRTCPRSAARFKADAHPEVNPRNQITKCPEDEEQQLGPPSLPPLAAEKYHNFQPFLSLWPIL